MNNITETIVTIAVAVVGLAMVAVIVSNRARTSEVITAGGNAFSNALRVAVSPVAGSGIGF
jgi:hypothetical protein